MAVNLNTNQFKQVPVRGELDLQIQKSGVIQAQISPNQATALKAGDAVKIDTAILTGQFPQLVAAAAADSTGFFLAFDPKKSSYSAGDVCSVTIPGGPVMYMVATGVITCGGLVESVGGSGTNVQAQSAAKIRGMALDPSPATGTLIRVLIFNYTPA